MEGNRTADVGWIPKTVSRHVAAAEGKEFAAELEKMFEGVVSASI